MQCLSSIVYFLLIGMIQPEHATLEGLENLDLSDLTLGIDWAFAQVRKEAFSGTYLLW